MCAYIVLFVHVSLYVFFIIIIYDKRRIIHITRVLFYYSSDKQHKT